MGQEILPLTTEGRNPLFPTKGRTLYFSRDKLEPTIEELELFLDGNNEMNNELFSKRILFSQEVKSNNGLEGYNDDLDIIYNVLYNKLSISDKTKMQRIKNLYNGYKYIFKNKTIDEDSLKGLYDILSSELLSDEDIEKMGSYYRTNPVYIYYSSNYNAEPDRGMDEKLLDFYMNELFNYINSNNNLNTLTDYFIKSQIIHFQFVNIHPYYDINGRTARTTSMWYLLNNGIHPYIIFNRAITLNKDKYYKVIKESRDYRNVTGFVDYMLEKVKVELEKEYIINMIKSSTKRLSLIEYQTLYYILSMNGLLTAKDFMTFYNKYNDKKKPTEILDTMLQPLIDKKIIIPTRETTSGIDSNNKNFVFELNDSKYDLDPQKIKRLNYCKK